MEYVPDNYDLYKQYAADQERELQKLPKCSVCGEPIQDDYCYVVNDEPVCDACMNRDFRKAVDDFVG